MTERRVPSSPCSMAELFLKGYLTASDVRSDGQVDEVVRHRAERRYTARAVQVPQPGPSSSRPRASRSTLRRPFSSRLGRASTPPPPSPLPPPPPLPPLPPPLPSSAVADVECLDGSTSRPAVLESCCICLSRRREFACVPCYHMCICTVCKDRVTNCPICRDTPEQIVRIYV